MKIFCLAVNLFAVLYFATRVHASEISDLIEDESPTIEEIIKEFDL